MIEDLLIIIHNDLCGKRPPRFELAHRCECLTEKKPKTLVGMATCPQQGSVVDIEILMSKVQYKDLNLNPFERNCDKIRLYKTVFVRNSYQSNVWVLLQLENSTRG